jgi:DivIVA domain-containing protein
MDQRRLTPAEVQGITFDKAPLGKRGYDEDQVDDFLDRIEATLAGHDSLTAQDIRDVVFDNAPMIKRGYHEDQVDEFLDRVVAEFERRTNVTTRVVMTAQVPAGSDETNPMLFSVPPSLPEITTRRQQREHHLDEMEHEPTEPVRGEAAPPVGLAFPLPPAPPGTRGYRPRDVEKLAMMIAATLNDVNAPSADEIATFRLSRTFLVGQGYHTEVVDELRAAWVAALRYRDS